MDSTLARIIWKLMPERFTPPPVGQTPSTLVAQAGRSSLLWYLPTVPVQFKTPIVFVPSLVNRHYILDLVPGRSVVEWLLNKGYPVYMVDWGEPGPEDSRTSMDDYTAVRLNHFVRTVCQRHDAPVTLAGYCMGGTMGLVYSTLEPSRVRNLVLLATPVDFSMCGLLSQWAQPGYLPVDWLVDSQGNMPAWLLQLAFTMLKPEWVGRQNQALVQGAGNREFLKGYLAMSRWVNDNVPVAGEAFRQWTRDYFQANGLVSRRLSCGGRKVEASNLNCSVLNVIAAKDHIIPPASSLALDALLKPETDNTHLMLDLGHIGLSVGQGAFSQVWSGVHTWLAGRSN